MMVHFHFMRVDPSGLHEVHRATNEDFDASHQLIPGNPYEVTDGEEDEIYLVWDVSSPRYMDSDTTAQEQHVQLIPQPRWKH